MLLKISMTTAEIVSAVVVSLPRTFWAILHMIAQNQMRRGRTRARRLRNQPTATRIKLANPSRVNTAVREIGAP
jgi:hypothetical protein